MRRLLVSRFWSPPLFHAQAPAERALNLALPLVWGLLCGLLSGIDRIAFTIGVVLSVLGAFGAGRQQLDAGSGLLRGLFAGTLFGVSVVAGHMLIGSGSMLIRPAPLQVFFTAGLGACCAACGGWSR